MSKCVVWRYAVVLTFNKSSLRCGWFPNYSVGTVQPKGLNINFSFIYTGPLYTSCARYHTRGRLDHFCLWYCVVLYNGFPHTEEGSYTRKRLKHFFFKTSDTFWYFFTEYHLFSYLGKFRCECVVVFSSPGGKCLGRGGPMSGFIPSPIIGIITSSSRRLRLSTNVTAE